MKIFGCEAIMHIRKEKAKKWDAKASKIIFIGCSEQKIGSGFSIQRQEKY